MERRLRVLAVDHTAGVAPFRRKFAAIASHPDVDLVVLAPNRWVENYQVVRLTARDTGVADGYRLLRGSVIWPGYENRGFFVSGLARAFRESKPDILHLWEEPYSVITLQALLLRRVLAPRSKAIFFTSDNLHEDRHYPTRPSWFYAGVERFAHRECALGTAVSGDVERVLRAKGYRGRTAIVPHGLDLAPYLSWNGDDRDAAEERAAARLGLTPPVVGYLGRLTEQKGVDTLLRAMVALPASSRATLAIVGDGPSRADLERMAKESGLGDRIRFLPPVPHGDVPATLAAFRILVLPSRTTPNLVEQFGRVLVEGMAAGCVVIGSSSGAIPSVVGDAGLIVREDDAADLAAAITRALSEPGLCAALRQRAAERVRREFTWDAVADRMVELYRELLP